MLLGFVKGASERVKAPFESVIVEILTKPPVTSATFAPTAGVPSGFTILPLIL